MDNCLYPTGLIAVFYECNSMVEGFYTQTSHIENPNGSLKTVYFKR